MLIYHEAFGSGEKRMRVWISALVALAATLTIATMSEAGENWPAWRGPRRDGVSAERNLPLRWDTEENITWKLALPEWSGSTPIIWGDKIFLNVADGRDIQLWCVDSKHRRANLEEAPQRRQPQRA